MRRTLIAGNWKMNGSFAANKNLVTDIIAAIEAQDLAHAEAVICPPAPYLAQCADLSSGSDLSLGAQDVSMHLYGAYTGEVSAGMLVDCGCKYVIVGHSERRAYHQEPDEVVAKKALRAVELGMVPIICVGETLAERESGHTNQVVIRQLKAVLDILNARVLPNIVVAYEPVWAIGTGKTATPQMVQEVHSVLRRLLFQKSADLSEEVRILYGGGMTKENAKVLLSMADVDGGLVGGASLRSADFIEILRSVQGDSGVNGL